MRIATTQQMRPPNKEAATANYGIYLDYKRCSTIIFRLARCHWPLHLSSYHGAEENGGRGRRKEVEYGGDVIFFFS